MKTLKKHGGDVSGDAVDHWNHYKEDIDLLVDAGLNAFRLSIEWAKVEPEKGKIDEDVLKHYEDVLKYLKKRKIVSCITLWHFSLPKWAADRGGMLNHDVRRHFYDYVRLCSKRFNSDVDIWTTINEPMVYLMEGYRWGKWPPGIRSRWKALRVFFALRSVHRNCHRILKRGGGKTVGIAKSIIVFECRKRANAFHQMKRAVKSFLWNRSFFSFAKRFHDCIGINFYIVETVGPKDKEFEKDDMGWEIRPHGLETAIRDAWRFGKPVYVLENGIATNDDGKRITYIESQKIDIRQSLKAGIDLRGYFHWSLLDNFEWAEGFGKKFGLIAIDRETMARTPKPSLKAYGSIAKKS